jgi:U1 small nuclear ribonucleoprotein 70kDa
MSLIIITVLFVQNNSNTLLNTHFFCVFFFFFGEMTKYLPPNLVVLFRARPPIEYIEPIVKRKLPQYTGISTFITQCRDSKLEGYEYTPGFESRPTKKRRKVEEKAQKHEDELKEKIPQYDPSHDEKIDGDAYKTLIVSRLPYEITEPALRREFEVYGTVRRVRLIYDLEGKPRGYGFVEFERERDMRNAYKQADGRRILGRRILVDVERGRTVKNWLPRRLGGGLANPRPNLPPKIGKKGKRYLFIFVSKFLSCV